MNGRFGQRLVSGCSRVAVDDVFEILADISIPVVCWVVGGARYVDGKEAPDAPGFLHASAEVEAPEVCQVQVVGARTEAVFGNGIPAVVEIGGVMGCGLIAADATTLGVILVFCQGRVVGGFDFDEAVFAIPDEGGVFEASGGGRQAGLAQAQGSGVSVGVVTGGADLTGRVGDGVVLVEGIRGVADRSSGAGVGVTADGGGAVANVIEGEATIKPGVVAVGFRYELTKRIVFPGPVTLAGAEGGATGIDGSALTKIIHGVIVGRVGFGCRGEIGVGFGIENVASSFPFVGDEVMGPGDGLNEAEAGGLKAVVEGGGGAASGLGDLIESACEVVIVCRLEFESRNGWATAGTVVRLKPSGRRY